MSLNSRIVVYYTSYNIYDRTEAERCRVVIAIGSNVAISLILRFHDVIVTDVIIDLITDVIDVVVVVVSSALSRRPLHLVLLLESTPRVSKPRRHLANANRTSHVLMR